MKAVVVYDSVHGNTEKIARAIGGAISSNTPIVRASDLTTQLIAGADILVIGCPTHGGRPTEPMKKALILLTSDVVKGVKVATFDTRLSSRFARIFGYAAERLAADLTGKGAVLASPPEGFIVLGSEGPLKDGEEARAAEWARRLVG